MSSTTFSFKPAFHSMVNRLITSPTGYTPVLEDAETRSELPDSFFTQRVNYIIERLAPGERVLDLACGKGAFLYYAKQRKGAVCVGLERRSDWRGESRKRNLQVYPSDLNDLDDLNLHWALSQKWDTVLIFDALHFFRYPAPILRALRLQSKRIFITIGNIYWYKYRLSMLKGNDPWPVFPNASVDYYNASHYIFDCEHEFRSLSLENHLKWFDGLGFSSKVLARRAKNEQFLPLPLFHKLFCRAYLIELIPKY